MVALAERIPEISIVPQEPPLPKGESRPALCNRFVRATREALTGATDCIVWWGNGNDRAFIAVMQELAEETAKQ